MNWWQPSDPDDIKPEPWMHPAAVLYLESLLTPEMSVIEHGCGGSTLWFAERVGILASYENKYILQWKEILLEFTNNTDNNYIADMGVLNYPPTPEKADADLLLIDGNNQDRPEWIMASKDLVKKGGIIVLDNAERPHYQKGRDYLMTFCHPPLAIAATTGLGKFVVTEFYRVKGGVNWI